MSRVCRWAGVLVALFVGAFASSVGPRGRVAAVPTSQTRNGASVVDERALISWDGSRKDILMSSGVSGSSDPAAWVMPVPSAAQVALGEAGVFAELCELTASRVKYRDSWWPTFSWLTSGGPSEGAMAGPPPGAGVDVLSRQRIGLFDVTRLAAQDPAALAKWLADNGFPYPDGLDTNLAPDVADGWEIGAVKLAPAAQGGRAGRAAHATCNH